MKNSLFAITLGLGLAASGAAMADDCGAPRTIDYCGGSAACGVMYVPYYDAHQDTPLLRSVELSGPHSGAVELPTISKTEPKSLCMAYLLPVGTYNVKATFADGVTASKGGVQVRAMHTAVTCPQVGVDLKMRDVDNNPILCRGLVRAAS